MRSRIPGTLKRICLFACAAWCMAADPAFLTRRVADIAPQPDDLTANSKGASYKPIFGIGDKDASLPKGVARFGELTVSSGGRSAIVSYPAEEQMYFILEGAGTLLYDGKEVPVKKHDFMYLPAGVKHGMGNSSGAPVRLLVTGYRIPADTKVEPTPELQLANAEDVQLQILGQHGPTSQFKLMMGTTRSRRDKLASAYVMNSMFIMDFAPGGTNIPHEHPVEEEIYYLVRGRGDMVAGKTADGKENRVPTGAGEAFFFPPKTLIGYYSGAKEGQEHDIMFALRSMLPGARFGRRPRP